MARLDCDGYGAEAGAARWVRLFPGHDQLNLGPACAQRLARRSAERDLLDTHRLIALARRLAGEVWQGPEANYWLDEPFLPRLAGLSSQELHDEVVRRRLGDLRGIP
jgi:hypothetical protein